MEIDEKNIEKLVRLAYEDAYSKESHPNFSNCADHIISVLETKKISLSERSILRAFNRYIKDKKNLGKPSKNTILAFCKYLDYESYADFIKKQQKTTKEVLDDKLSNENDSAKITNVKIINFDEFQKSNKGNKSLVLLAALLGFIGLYFLVLHNNTSKTQQFTINNFNTNAHYYYYTNPAGKLELTENPKIANAKPLTYNVLNTYLKEQEIDTTQENIKFIKAYFFDNENTAKPLQGNNNTVTQVEPISEKPKVALPKSKPETKVAKPKKEPLTSAKTLKIVLNDDALYAQISNKLKTDYTISRQSNTTYVFKGEVTYTYKETGISKGLQTCILTLNYTITTKKHENIKSANIISKGSGFSKASAKQNAISKLKL